MQTISLLNYDYLSKPRKSGFSGACSTALDATMQLFFSFEVLV